LGRPAGKGEKVEKQLLEKNLNKEYLVKMREAGLSVNKLAEHIGVSRLTMNSYLNKK
jgi:plasmid maintenance system antidote protein VapI